MSFPFIVEMGWKSALIAGAALLLAALLRSRSAADRTALLRLAVGLLLALPAISLLFPALQVEMAVPAAPEAEPLLRSALPPPAGAATALPAAASAQGGWNDPGILVALLYGGGLLMVALRLTAGLWTLRRWTRAASELACPEWRAALERALTDGAPPLRVLVSYEAPAPMSWGWRKPVILLDADALRRSDDADAILAHEIAHIVRRDWPTLIVARLAVALFWFNPLVWLLERTIVQQAEEAADSDAVARIEPGRYAQTLLNCAQHDLHLPASSIASGCLGRRIKAVLDGGFPRARSGSWRTVAAMLGCVALGAPVAAMKLVPAMAASAEPARPLARIGQLSISAVEPPIPVAAPAPPAAPA
ncbi:MAG TPA: M56 family metallopeptidase, partial [Allosphingosinicella sp.]|nr:M56 family metallopeptidase [Allosphingosinicella sp.]